MMKIVSALFLGLLLLGGPALGQGAPQTVKMCIPSSGTSCPVVNASNPLPIVGSFSATLSGFTPNGNYGALTATAASSVSTAMPAGTSVAFQNTSTVDVSCVLSAGAATATTNKIIVRGGATVFLTVGSNVNAACINQTGSASNVIVMAGGSGLGTNFGGGGGGGGGGGAVTVADGADVTQGALADAAATAGGTGSLSAKMRLMTTQLATINTTLGTPLQAGGTVTANLGTLNGAATAALQTAAAAAKGEGATGSAVPSGAQYLGLNIGGNLTGATGLATGATVKALTVAIVDASGNQVTSFGGSGGTASNFGSAFPSAGTAIGFTDGTNMVAGRVTTWGTTPTGFNALAVNANVLASALPTGAATAANQSTEITALNTIATNSGLPVPVNVNAVATALTGVTPGVTQTGTIVAANMDLTSVGGVAIGAMANYGTSPGAVKVQGVNAFVTNAPTVQPGNTANTTPWLTTPSAGSTSGATPSFVVAANSNNSTNLKGSAGTVYSIQTSNINASTAYFIKLYDKATAPTCGTDTPVAGYVIPPSNGGNNVTIAVGKKFTSGIGYCVVAGIANNDNTSVPAATILVNVDYN